MSSFNQRELSGCQTYSKKQHELTYFMWSVHPWISCLEGTVCHMNDLYGHTRTIYAIETTSSLDSKSSRANLWYLFSAHKILPAGCFWRRVILWTEGLALPLSRCVEPVKSPSVPEAQVPGRCSTNISSQVIVELGVVFCECPLQAVKEKAMAPHSSTLAWKIPWAEEPGRLQSMGSLWVGHDWATSLSLYRL